MHRIFRGLVGTIVVALAVLGAVIAFDTMSFGVQDSILVVGVAQLGASDFILS